MTEISSIDVFNALKDKAGEKEAKMLTEFVEHKANDSYEKAERQLATKQDLAKLEAATKQDLIRLEMTLKESIAKLELSTNAGMKELSDRLSNIKSDSLKWTLAFLTPFYLILIGFIIKYVSDIMHTVKN